MYHCSSNSLGLPLLLLLPHFQARMVFLNYLRPSYSPSSNLQKNTIILKSKLFTAIPKSLYNLKASLSAYGLSLHFLCSLHFTHGYLLLPFKSMKIISSKGNLLMLLCLESPSDHKEITQMSSQQRPSLTIVDTSCHSLPYFPILFFPGSI